MGLTRADFDKEYQRGVAANEYPSLDEELLEYLHREYGKQSFTILKMIKANPASGQRFLPENEFIPAEIEWICDHEQALHLIDVLCRRTEMWLFVHHAKSEQIAQKVADVMAAKYNWDPKTKQQEIKTYVDYQKAWVWWKK